MIDQRQAACDLVALEARLLDERDWDGWLALFEEDAQLWVPTWRDEETLTEDPELELSFLFIQGRAMLAERVYRLRSGRSPASTPLPRTVHIVSGSQVGEDNDRELRVYSAWSCLCYEHKEGSLTTLAGRYQHVLAKNDAGLRIRRKKVMLINDRLTNPADFFSL